MLDRSCVRPVRSKKCVSHCNRIRICVTKRVDLTAPSLQSDLDLNSPKNNKEENYLSPNQRFSKTQVTFYIISQGR